MLPKIILLNGTSSSGKSSIARALQQQAGIPLLHVSLDAFTDMFSWDAIPDPALRRECHAIGVANFHRALPLLASSRFTVVVDHVFEQPAWHEACRVALREHSLCFVGARCPLAVVEAREKNRGDRRIGLAAWQFRQVHENKTYDLEVDTSVDSPEVCAKKILAFAPSCAPAP